MRTMLKFFSSFCVLSFILLSFGCNGAAVDGLGGFVPPVTTTPTIPTSGDTTAPAISGTSNSISGDDTFYVGIDSQVTPIAHVHLSSGYSNPCVIPQSTTTSQDLDCYIEVPEGTLRYNGIHLKINQPAQMCNVIGYYPYWYYNEEVGYGPTSVTINTEKTILASGDITWSASADCTVGNDGNPGVPDGNCNNQSELVLNYSSTDGGVQGFCVYDKSGIGHNHNCCLGTYRKVVNVTTFDIALATTTVDTTITDESWGGNMLECVGGQGHGWSFLDSNDFPIGAVFQNDSSDPATPNSKEITIMAPSSAVKVEANRSFQNNIHAANYYDPTAHTHTGSIVAATSTAPFYVDPIEDRSGSPMISGSSNYVVDCLDAAEEVKHRMTVHVREWNSYADFLVYVSTLGVTANPDRTGNETIGGACDGDRKSVV